MPFLRHVTRGRGVPENRLAQVRAHYDLFGGVSPINAATRALAAAVQAELDRSGPALPVFWANRHWHPLLPDVLARMRDAGVRHALAFTTSLFSSASGCRDYREDIARAQATVGPSAPAVTTLRRAGTDPGFVHPMADSAVRTLTRLPAGSRLVFTAHSVPLVAAEASGRTGGAYQRELGAAAGLVADRVAAQGLPADGWRLAWQSRSGPPSQPWLTPDVRDVLRELHAQGAPGVVLVPLGFVSDHMEVVYDLDTEAAGLARELGLPLGRAATVGTAPRFVRLVRDLVEERRTGLRVDGTGGPVRWACPRTCCRPRRS